MQGFGRKYLTIGRLSPRTGYRVVASNGQGKPLEGKAFTDLAGTLNWSGAINGPKVQIEITRMKK